MKYTIDVADACKEQIEGVNKIQETAGGFVEFLNDKQEVIFGINKGMLVSYKKTGE